MNPKVSIIVPVYNVENYLSECLDSIISQSFDDIEIICINDGSTDDSLSVLENYASKDKRIKIISQENRGIGHARNRGLNISSGDYVLFVDSDDCIFSDTVESLYENAVNNDSDLVLFKYALSMDADRNSYSYGFECRPNFPKGTDFNSLSFDYKSIRNHVLNSFTNVWIAFYKRDFLNGYDDFYFQENLAYEDVLYHLKSFLRAERISYIPRVFYFYRENPNSIMHQPKHSFDIFTVIDSVKDFLLENDFYEEFKDEFDYFKIQHTLHYVRCTNSEEFFQKTKEEFSKISLSESHLIDSRRLKLYELVLESSNYNQYLRGNFKIKEDGLKSQIDSLKKKNEALEKSNRDLNIEIEALQKENDLIRSRNENMNRRIGDYKSRKAVRFAEAIKSLKFF